MTSNRKTKVVNRAAFGFIRDASSNLPTNSTYSRDIPAIMYDLPAFSLGDDRAALEATINNASAGSPGNPTVVNITSKTVFECPGRLQGNLINNYVNIVGDSDGQERVIVFGNIIPKSCMFILDERDELYSRFPLEQRQNIYVVPIINMGLSLGQQFVNNVGPSDGAEKNIDEPIVCCLNGRALNLCCDTKSGLNNWRVVATTGGDASKTIASMTEINGTNTYTHPASHIDLIGIVAHINYDCRSMRFSSTSANILTMTTAPYSVSDLQSHKIKLFNAPEFLSQRGEYYISWQYGRLYFIPWENESIERLSVSTPAGEWAGTNRAAAIFDLTGSKTQALTFTQDRYNQIEGFTFEACYNTPIRLGRNCKAKRIKVNGARWLGVVSENPHAIEIDSCEFNDMWRGAISTTFGAQLTSSSNQTCTINGYDSNGYQPSKNKSFTFFNGWLDNSYSGVTISNNTIQRSGIVWHAWTACRINANNVSVTGNTFTYLTHQAIAVGAECSATIYRNTFDYCCQSLTEGGVIYGGRSWTQYAKIYENLFKNVRRVRSGSGEDYLTAIMWDDMAAGLVTQDNYIKDCDYGIQLNSSPSSHYNNIFDNVGQTFAHNRFRAYNSSNPANRENYQGSSLRGVGILEKVVAIFRGIGTPIYSLHPILWDGSQYTTLGNLLNDFINTYDVELDAIGKFDSVTVPTAITNTMISMPLEAPNTSDSSDNQVGQRFSMNNINIEYHPQQLINGSTMYTFPTAADLNIVTTVLSHKPVSHWDSIQI